MQAKAFVIAIILLVSNLQAQSRSILSPAEINALYEKANTYFNLSHPTPATDSQALRLFSKIINELEKTQSRAIILFQSYIHKGVLLDVTRNYKEALGAYTGALGCLHRHPDWNDSLFFKVYIYAGPDYYQLEFFDSAYDMLNKAELLADKFPGLPERDRLYNALGALYYESGNYLQSKNYFARALEIIRKDRPGDKVSIINFENNIATCLYKLGAYRESLTIYNHLILFGQSSSQLYLNMGKSYIGIEEYSHALILYRKVSPLENPAIFNEMAYAELLMGKEDSALFFLDQWRLTVDRTDQTKIDGGINDLYRAQVLITNRQPIAAMEFLQQAIITFSGNFKNSSIRANPLNFAGSFASYRLFDALSYKAHALAKLYAQNGNEEYLQDALNAYNSAILLFRYIEKTYTTDDAKLFLNKNNRDLYENAFLICLDLERLHPGGPYLEKAFIIAEKSKASIISGSLDEMASRNMPGMDPKLLQKQRDIKYNIARLGIKSDLERGSAVTPATAIQKADYEIELSFIQKNLELNSSYYKMKFEDTCPNVKELQRRLTADQAIVSLFVSKAGLHVFSLTSSSFTYFFIDSLSSLTEHVKSWTDMLSVTERGRPFGNRALEAYLSRRLVRPLLASLRGQDEWTLIPDGIFCLLPFESLPLGEEHHFLIENTTISYQLSSKFLVPPFQKAVEKFNKYSVLSFAPFAGKGEWVTTHSLHFIERLSGSGPEISNLPGKQFINEQATKEHFLMEINHYPVVHLATHALSDPQNSQGSVICFYPHGKPTKEDNLFLPELYGLNMDSTDLVILSACESGKGEIVNNEGIISLSRGFMYAGCASTVNSLWKADDRSTEEILRQFHRYLETGYTKSAALRRAKLDYINSNAIYTTPNYWAHLILIGNTDPIMAREGLSWFYFLILFGILVSVLIIALIIWRARSAYLSRSSSSPAY
jgi:CHAT domain-containing protein